MSARIEDLKAKLRQAFRDEMSEETVEVVLTLNAYGFYTNIRQRSADGLKDEGISMRNLKGDWIIDKN
jgi:hypothetical protein